MRWFLGRPHQINRGCCTASMEVLPAILGKCGRDTDFGHRPHSACFHLIDEAALRRADAHRIGKHRLEHRSEFTARRRDDLKDLGGCRLLLACFSQFDGTAAKFSPQIGSRRTTRVPGFRLGLALRLGSLSTQFACTTPFRGTFRHVQPLISGVGILSA